MNTLIIIPAYNEACSLGRVIDRVRDVRPQDDILVVNDASTDATAQVARRHGAAVITLPTNLGIGGAMQTGFRYAWEQGYDFVCQVDGDGQHDPTFLPHLFEPLLRDDADLVIGSRFLRKQGYQSTSIRRCGIAFFSWLISVLTGTRITDATSGFRAMNRKVLAVFARDYAVDYPEPEMLIVLYRYGLRVREIPVIMHTRQGGVSSITLTRSTYYASKVTLAIVLGMVKKC
ncbi:MAG: glycosyltransferase family 2 protein [Nitrospirae bacterium]|nr:MAG: glycosyltransferase family 2 protein [Nitrospirota bacterium]